MRRCPTCSEEVLERAAACHRCHTLLPEAKSPSEGAAGRRAGRVARLCLIAGSAAMLGAAAEPALRRVDGCQPRSWADWHLAMRRQCLSQEYVCRNMTTAQMLADPDVAAEYRSGLAGGRDASLELAELVGGMRRSYGCSPEVGAAAGPPSRAWLPKGHPPIGDRLPPGHPPIGGRLPPGHPPVGDHLPPGHPPLGDLAPSFEPPSTFDI